MDTRTGGDRSEFESGFNEGRGGGNDGMRDSNIPVDRGGGSDEISSASELIRHQFALGTGDAGAKGLLELGQRRDNFFTFVGLDPSLDWMVRGAMKNLTETVENKLFGLQDRLEQTSSLTGGPTLYMMRFNENSHQLEWVTVYPSLGVDVRTTLHDVLQSELAIAERGINANSRATLDIHSERDAAFAAIEQEATQNFQNGKILPGALINGTLTVAPPGTY